MEMALFISDKNVETCKLGVPTLKKCHPIWLGDGYFDQLFMRISKM